MHPGASRKRYERDTYAQHRLNTAPAHWWVSAGDGGPGRHRHGDTDSGAAPGPPPSPRTRSPALTRPASLAGTAVVPPPGTPGVRRSPRTTLFGARRLPRAPTGVAARSCSTSVSSMWTPHVPHDLRAPPATAVRYLPIPSDTAAALRLSRRALGEPREPPRRLLDDPPGLNFRRSGLPSGGQGENSPAGDCGLGISTPAGRRGRVRAEPLSVVPVGLALRFLRGHGHVRAACTAFTPKIPSQATTRPVDPRVRDPDRGQRDGEHQGDDPEAEALPEGPVACAGGVPPRATTICCSAKCRRTRRSSVPPSRCSTFSRNESMSADSYSAPSSPRACRVASSSSLELRVTGFHALTVRPAAPASVGPTPLFVPRATWGVRTYGPRCGIGDSQQLLDFAAGSHGARRDGPL